MVTEVGTSPPPQYAWNSDLNRMIALGGKLYITDGNEPSERLFRSLGAVAVG